MTDSFYIQVDMDKLAKNLSKAEGKQYTEVEVLALLVDNGFIRQAQLGKDWFIAEEISVAILERGEIKDARVFA